MWYVIQHCPLTRLLLQSLQPANGDLSRGTMHVLAVLVAADQLAVAYGGGCEVLVVHDRRGPILRIDLRQ